VALSTYWVGESFLQGFDGETWVKKDHLENPGVDWRIILKWISKKRDKKQGLDRSSWE
jgi:hypothetical protein